MTDHQTKITTDREKIFVLLAEIRQCINDDHLMAAQRKVMAIEAVMQQGEWADLRARAISLMEVTPPRSREEQLEVERLIADLAKADSR